MAYEIHDFKPQDVIRSSDINDMDAQILSNLKAIVALKKFVGYTGGTTVTENVPFTIVQGHITGAGAFVDNGNTGWHVTDYTDITSYEKLICSGSMGWGNAIVAFYTRDNTYISSINADASSYTDMVEQEVNIPQGAVYVRVCQSDSKQHILIKGVYTKEE